MKKFLIALFICLGFATITNAQSAKLMSLAAGDTISTSATLDTVTKTIGVTANYPSFGVQVVYTKLSGTPATKAYLSASIDGTNYVVTDSSAVFTDITTNTAYFLKTSTPYTSYKVQVRNVGGGTTTESGIVRVYYTARK